MLHHSVIRYQEGMCFQAELDNHKLLLDAEETFGGQNLGPRPKKLLLAALAGCTGMDVVSILNKMKVPFSEFWLEVEAELTETEPKVYKSFTIFYNLRGENLNREKIEKAIALSQERYCGVSAMFRHFAPINIVLRLNP